jgi:[pyruvate, water dikinase]-phosphate phosphotransferase / [pyruvate, water dikinase] kinase
MKRTIFFLSDSTGITVEDLGHSLLSQFKEIDFEKITIPYINSIENAHDAAKKIHQICKSTKTKPLIFSSLVEPKTREIIAKCDGFIIDIFDIFIPLLTKELKIEPTKDVGKTHGVFDIKTYETRIDAVHFAIDSDDGSNIKSYNMADIILVGVSRCGKTPTCLYMALQFGIYSANYPITEEDMLSNTLPKVLLPHRDKLFGLVISPQRLHAIRKERKPDSRYASLKQCRLELDQTEEMFKKAHIPYLNSTTFSIEEISTKIIAAADIERH